MSTNAWTPRGLRAPEAALYIGVGKSKFFELVAAGKLPKAKKIDGCVVWDRLALDAAFDTLGEESSSENPWDSLCA
ncbi:MAG: hypothetical protein Q8J92_05865 [Parvibaculum sp.]|uniref:hypothetical protein n=1 Tax=Parvibaculum sp. TaxID=2024848 RepID=UPI00271EF755|nr:hypothetical protein [Parvibaculum sp.]MDO8839446.1 hypothetical protein [Parvibaculum sp.]MDP2123891.1 hypothetical protein [Parvibaculum sp.]